jgi:hypothetical protein
MPQHGLQSSLFLRINIVCAVAIALMSIFLCATFRLYVPHAVGHLFPAASIAIAFAWSVLCGILAKQNGRSWRVALVPGALVVVAAIVFSLHYRAEVLAGQVYFN